MNKPAPINNNEDKSSDNDSGIIVCGVCKNVASTLPVIRAAFEDLVKKAGVPCWAMFYENNSDDGTDAELMKWASEMPDRVKVKCEKIPREEEQEAPVPRPCLRQSQRQRSCRPLPCRHIPLGT